MLDYFVEVVAVAVAVYFVHLIKILVEQHFEHLKIIKNIICNIRIKQKFLKINLLEID